MATTAAAYATRFATNQGSWSIESVGLSAVSIGLGVVLQPESTFAMWVGALVFWIMGRRHRESGTRGHDFWVEGLEPICAGLISGAALMGIGNAILNVLMN